MIKNQSDLLILKPDTINSKSLNLSSDETKKKKKKRKNKKKKKRGIEIDNQIETVPSSS